MVNARVEISGAVEWKAAICWLAQKGMLAKDLRKPVGHPLAL